MKRNQSKWAIEDLYLSGYTGPYQALRLNGDKRHCPRCNNILWREKLDLFCLHCGWRDSFHFGIENERKAGIMARLLSNRTMDINDIPAGVIY